MSILVSIICNTYNQEPFIAQTLDSLLMQKTEFPYEILIHDDASTDRTADIIREYAQKYPDIIKPTLQTQNQYSQGVNICDDIQFPKAEGEYIAICEGDDYWTDPLKLQKQVQALQSYPEIDICTHRTQIIQNGTVINHIPQQATDTVFTAEQVILGGGGFVMTNSLLFRRRILIYDYQFYKMYSFDYALQVLGALRGGMLYLGDCMSAYRQFAPGSWTSRMRKNVQAAVQHSLNVEKLLHCLNEDTNGQYAEAIEKKLRINLIRRLEMCDNYKEIFKKENRIALRELDKKAQLKLRLKAVRHILLSRTKPKI